MSSKSDDDHYALDEILRIIRFHLPDAKSAEFQISEANDFGFDLWDISTEDGPLSVTDYELFEGIEGRIRGLLHDIDWGSAMEEDEHGYSCHWLD